MVKRKSLAIFSLCATRGFLSLKYLIAEITVIALLSMNKQLFSVLNFKLSLNTKF